MKKLLLACYAHLLVMYPRKFRRHYAREMQLFMRDYARDRGTFALSLLLFTDLLVSVPEQHYYEVRMSRSRSSLPFFVSGAILFMAGAALLVQDAANPALRMGFFAVLVVTTLLLVGALLMSKPLHRATWLARFAPVIYAVAASVWLLVTPRVVAHGFGGGASWLFERMRDAVLSLGMPAGIALLVIPVAIALVPALRSGNRRALNLATLAMAAFVVLTAGFFGGAYVPVLLALVVLRATSSPTMPAISAS